MSEHSVSLKEIENCIYGIWFNRKIVRKVEGLDRENIRDNISFYLEKADKLGIPFRIQNKVLDQGEKQMDFYGPFWNEIKSQMSETNSQ